MGIVFLSFWSCWCSSRSLITVSRIWRVRTRLALRSRPDPTKQEALGGVGANWLELNPCNSARWPLDVTYLTLA